MADLRARARVSRGLDDHTVAERAPNWLRDMRRACLTCDARSRCRRDLNTGDFARRYRHYCPNAESLARIAAGTARNTGTPRQTPQA